jgi:hypothetical protein
MKSEVQRVIDHVKNGGNLENSLSGYRTIQLDSAEILVREIERLRESLRLISEDPGGGFNSVDEAVRALNADPNPEGE